MILASFITFAQNGKVEVVKSGNGFKLSVDGKEMFINGMNWDYFPIGTNYNYSLWTQSDDVIIAALNGEMPLLKNMGVNVIRQYTGVPPKWVKYIYENYGIYTMLNHSFGRYGLTIKGKWEPNTDYSNPDVREILLKETKEMVSQYKETPGVLVFYWVMKITMVYFGEVLKPRTYQWPIENLRKGPTFYISCLMKQ